MSLLRRVGRVVEFSLHAVLFRFRGVVVVGGSWWESFTLEPRKKCDACVFQKLKSLE